MNDSSKSNIMVRTLNVIKAACVLIEVIERVKQKFGFLSRRVFEVRSKILTICTAFMAEVRSEEEMRFYLMETDLDERDSLMLVFDFDLIELLEHPFSQSIVYNIWTSHYDTSNSMLSVSTAYTLLFDYNHCRYDDEVKMRPALKSSIDLARFGCHDFQFQVWRYSGQSRHLVYSLFTLLLIIWYHLLIINHLSKAIELDHKHVEMYKIYEYREGINTTDLRTPVEIAADDVKYDAEKAEAGCAERIEIIIVRK